MPIFVKKNLYFSKFVVYYFEIKKLSTLVVRHRPWGGTKLFSKFVVKLAW
jgi:hypothetical protein